MITQWSTSFREQQNQPVAQLMTLNTPLSEYNTTIFNKVVISMGCSQSQNEVDSYGMLSKPHIFFLIGGPGAGKGTQAQNLVRDYKFKHLSTGDLLREEMKKGGELAQTIDSYIKEGKLLPSELVVKLLKKGISTYGNRRYLLDGFPRNEQNWKEFEKQLGPIVVVRNLIFLDCPDDVMVDRIMERAKSSGRSDDNPETIKKRLETFDKETLPIVKAFDSRGNCLHIKAAQSREEVYEEIQEKLREANVEPPARANMIFVMGGPGAGKGTQCAILVKKYGFIHLSTGDLLRDQVKSGSPLGQEIEAVIKDGKLVSSKLMVALIREKMERNNYGGRYLLDGFPRGQENMDVWESEMSKWINLKTAMYFECNEEELARRVIQRGQTSGRSDDNAEAIVKRLRVFKENNGPVINHYTQIGKLKRFDATQPIQAVTQAVDNHLQELGIFPRKPMQERPKGIILCGNPGSGKSTQSVNICNRFGFHHVSAGDLMRQEIKKGGRHAELFDDYIKQGKLAPADIVVQLIKQVVTMYKWNGVFVFDGFPRNKDNLVKWYQTLGVEIDLQYMFLLDCEEERAKARCIARNAERADDNPASVEMKIHTYKKETYPVILTYLKQDDFTFQIDANPPEAEVFASISKVLEEHGYKPQEKN